MPTVHTIPRKIRIAAESYNALKKDARDLTNEANRKKTEFKNVVKTHFKDEDIPVGSVLRVSGHAFALEAARKVVIPSSALFEMFKNEEITEAEFLACIKVNKTDVERELGGDVALRLEVEEVGKKADIRHAELTADEQEDDGIYIKEEATRRRAPTKRRRIGRTRAATKTTIAKRKRKIRVKG